MDKHTTEHEALDLAIGRLEVTALAIKAERDRLAADCMTLTLRLMGEDDNTFAPETREVMSRWRPMAEALLRGKPA